MIAKILENIVSNAQTAIFAIIAAAFTAVSGVAIAYINVLKDKAIKSVEQIELEKRQRKIDAATYQHEKITETIVMSIEQEEKQKIVEMIEDNKLDEKELYALRELAVSRILNQIKPETKAILTDAYGDLAVYTSDLVSRKVLELKRASK